MRVLAAVALVLSAAAFAGAGPQESPAPPADPLIEALEKEKKRLTLEAEIAKKRKEIREAKTVEVTPLEGTISVDAEKSFEPVLLAHAALQPVADDVIGRLVRARVRRILVGTSQDVSALRACLAFKGTAAAFTARYRALLGANVSPVAGVAAPAALKAALDALALFRSDVSIEGRAITLKEAALLASLVDKSQGRVEVLDRELAGASSAAAVTTVLVAVEDVLRAHAQAHAAALGPEAALTRDALDAAFKLWRETWEADHAKELSSVLVGARLAHAIGADGRLIAAEILDAGGSTRVRRNFFTMVFTGAAISYSGGVAVSYLAIKPDTGVIDLGGVVTCYSGFTRTTRSLVCK